MPFWSSLSSDKSVFSFFLKNRLLCEQWSIYISLKKPPLSVWHQPSFFPFPVVCIIREIISWYLFCFVDIDVLLCLSFYFLLCLSLPPFFPQSDVRARPEWPTSRAGWNSWLAMFFKHHAATKAWQDDRSAPQCIVTNKLVQRCFSLHTRCVGLWYGTADEKVSTSHLCFSVTIGAAISAEQSGANIQADHMCHRIMQKTLLKEEGVHHFSHHTAP